MKLLRLLLQKKVLNGQENWNIRNNLTVNRYRGILIKVRKRRNL